MLWIALRFAVLPLEVFIRASRPAGPVVVSTGTQAHARIVVPDDAAKKCGIRSDMTLPAALALAADLHVIARDAEAEHDALERIAAWAFQLTPAVSIAPPAEVLLEISGSLVLFGGLNRLLARIAEGVRALGYSAATACAPTPLAAQLFARAGLAARIRRPDALLLNLGRLPAGVLESAPQELLRNLGIRTIADILRLPRSGVACRFGQTVLDDLDRALGRLPDPRANFTPPTNYVATQFLPAPADAAEMVLFATSRLLTELCGYLGASRQGIQRLHLMLSHDDRTSTLVELSLVAATRDAAHLTNVLRERLERTALPRPVTAITLESRLLLPLPAANLPLLPDATRETGLADRLIECLRARLGHGAVCGLGLAADHRPERAWCFIEPAQIDCSYMFLKDLYFNRPLWLLPTPRLLVTAEILSDGGPLKLLSRAERIESGWWDGNPVARDYYVAHNQSGALLWIYRQPGADGGWFLHGYFA